jgi:nucleoside diphosphate kinase
MNTKAFMISIVMMMTMMMMMVMVMETRAVKEMRKCKG